MSVDQTIGDNVESSLNFQGADVYNVGSAKIAAAPLHDTANSGKRIYAPYPTTTGVLMIVGQARWNSGTNDLVQLRIRKGGGTELGKTVLATGSASADAPVLQVVAFDNTPAAGDGSNYNGDYYELLALGKGAGGNVVTAVGTFFAVQEIV